MSLHELFALQSGQGCALTATADVSVSTLNYSTLNFTTLNYSTFQGNHARNDMQTCERMLTPSNVNSGSQGCTFMDVKVVPGFHLQA